VSRLRLRARGMIWQAATLASYRQVAPTRARDDRRGSFS